MQREILKVKSFWHNKIADAFFYLHRCTEQEKSQVKKREARQDVLLHRHWASVLFMLAVHHHHVDHEAHGGQAENKAEQEGVFPPGKEKKIRAIFLAYKTSDLEFESHLG